ncbi:LNS2-domain-containing protein [Leucogyrophana mollusca]|uniref:LNS2-domain-containing protein n=1 Tax=Leucogyrophana mollusca TaxID=85980 RepID=A0ACB8BBI1_9AGAM|nr:LNS2-domain-containing protein [Leucogyrophana mollusca]
MNYIRGAVSAISAPYQYYRDLPPINPSTLTGAIDVIVIRRPTDTGDISLACSPFHVRFGKLQVLRPAEKKVNIFVNGNPIPFSMKIGDAGEAFFIFETDEDIPEDLVTSPLLQATQPAEDVGVESDRFGAKRPDGDVTVKVEPKGEMQEPEFLDLNASLDSPPTSQTYPPADTPMNLSDHVDEASSALESMSMPPVVHYADGVALDMEEYHSHGRDASDRTVTSDNTSGPSSHNIASAGSSPSHTPQASRSPSPDARIAFPSKSRKASLLKTSFPARRAVSESPSDFAESTLHDALEVGSPPLQEYSWEWGAFPQPSPMTPHFPNAGSMKGKAKAPMRTDTLEQPDDEDDLTLMRSRSVPPELEGSPHTIRSALPLVEDEHTIGVREESGGFGSGGMMTARPDDPTKFQVWIEGKVVDFELSLVSSTEVFNGRDEVEAARIFDKGKIDYRRLVEDESAVRDDGLVIKWAGGQYIARSDGSPLMDALNLWCATAPRDHLEHLPSPTSPEEQPLSSADEPEEPKRADSEPPETSRKPTSSSWVRWWSRSKDPGEGELGSSRPALRVSNTVPLDTISKPLPVPVPPQPRAHAPSASVPSPSTPAEGKSPAIEPLGDALRAKIARTQKKFAKTLRLSSDQLKSLNLKSGSNTITFSLSTTGAPACTARIFVWDSTDLVVVSDIDGTITKSDGLGHIFTMIGRDWTHLGVAKLYTDITRNGYKIMYLTSRAIGQADSTRDYLRGIKQNDYQLPEGPVIMSPDRLMASLHREVIMRKPEVFKMACLRDIQRLFGEATRSPFYAGFGNRITDALSYRSVNIPSARIFTIDSSGEVKLELLELAGYKSSYIHMTDLVDQMFPPIHRKWAAEFTDFNYWKQPVQEFPLPDLTPASPALSARSDTSNQSALARLRNFSLVGTRQSNNMKQFSLPPPATAPEGTPTTGDGHRSSHLRQMSSLERLSSRLAALTQSSSSTVDGLSESPASRSSTSTFLDSDDEDEGEGGAFKGRRPRSRSMTSMPGSLDDMQFGMDSDGDVEAGYGYGGEEESVENEEEAAEEAFDEDFFTTREMNNVPYP